VTGGAPTELREAEALGAVKPPRATVDEPDMDTTPHGTTAPTCEIRFWRGYRKAAFYARTIDGGEELAVAESPLFRARGNGLPERTEEAAAAYAALVERIESMGWRRVASGSAWFDATFEL